MSTHARIIASAVAATLMASAAALPAQADQPWNFEFTPYLWAAATDGDVTVGAQSAQVSVSFSELLDTLDFGGGFLMRGQRGSWVFWTQLDYLKTDTDNLDNPPEHADLEVGTTMLTAGFGRNFESSNGRRSVDVLLGIRHLGLDIDLTFDTLGKFTRDRNYNDPIIIIRPTFQSSEKWSFGSTMSFGAGGDSESTYELQPNFIY